MKTAEKSTKTSAIPRQSAAKAAGILEKSIPILALFAISSGVGYHISIPAGLAVAGALVWVDMSIHAYRGRRDADSQSFPPEH